MKDKLNSILVLVLMMILLLLNSKSFELIVVGLLFVIITEIDKNKMIK